MPAAIATVPSNGPVAANTTATPSVAHGGSGFLQVLQDLSTANTPGGTPDAGATVVSGQTAPNAFDAIPPSDPPDCAPPASLVAATDGAAQPPMVPTPEAPRDAKDGGATVRKGSRTSKPTDPAEVSAPLLQIADPAPVQVAMPATERPTIEPASSQVVIPDGEAGPSGKVAVTASLNAADRTGRSDAGSDAPGTPPPGKAADTTPAATPNDKPGEANHSDQTAQGGLKSPRLQTSSITSVGASTPTGQSDATSAGQGHKAWLHMVPQAAGGTSPAAGTEPSPGVAAIPSFVLAPQPTETNVDASAPISPTPASKAAVATPAAQIAPALLSLGHAADGSQQMTLRLHPADMGTVQVQIGRTETGSARVEITVEKADTLQTLMRDQPQLHRALDDAGVPAVGRTITFHTAPPASMPAGGNDSPSWASAQSGPGSASGNNSSGGGKGGYTGSEPDGGSGGRRHSQPSGETTGPAGAASYRVGLNIIA